MTLSRSAAAAMLGSTAGELAAVAGINAGSAGGASFAAWGAFSTAAVDGPTDAAEEIAGSAGAIA